MVENANLHLFTISLEIFVCAHNLTTGFDRLLRSFRNGLSIIFSLSMDQPNIMIWCVTCTIYEDISGCIHMDRHKCRN